MKLIRYSLVCLICGLMVTVTGCQKQHAQVINTSSGIVIHSSDFTGGQPTQKVASTVRLEQKSQPTAKSTGTVIHLGDGYEKIDVGPIFIQ